MIIYLRGCCQLIFHLYCSHLPVQLKFKLLSTCHGSPPIQGGYHKLIGGCQVHVEADVRGEQRVSVLNPL